MDVDFFNKYRVNWAMYNVDTKTVYKCMETTWFNSVKEIIGLLLSVSTDVYICDD